MDATHYAPTLAAVLASASDEVADRLARLLAVARAEEVGSVVVDVFVDQDGEGPFDVRARFDGPGAFALDRRLDEDRHLFGVEWGERGWEPDVPARPRGWTRDDLEAEVVQVVARWIEPLLPAGSPEGFWRVGTPDGTHR